MGIFERYSPFVQDFIYENGWQTLRGVQVAAGDAIFNSDANVLLTASTASGKTEAAFFPILTLFDEDPPRSVGAVYIGPLKALINDQFRRLYPLCERGGIPVWHWHGDVSASHKAKLLKHPSGILQITPESLESLLLHKHAAIPGLFGDLRFIVIDEVHSLLRGDRGGQTLCLMERLCRAAECNPRRIGLSATIGDPEATGEFLGRGTGRPTLIPDIREDEIPPVLTVEHFYINGPQAAGDPAGTLAVGAQPGANGQGNRIAGEPASIDNEGNPVYNGWATAPGRGNPNGYRQAGTAGSGKPGAGDPANVSNWSNSGDFDPVSATGWSNPEAGNPSTASGGGDPNGYRQVGAANWGNPGYNGWASAHGEGNPASAANWGNPGDFDPVSATGGDDPNSYHQAGTTSWGNPSTAEPTDPASADYRGNLPGNGWTGTDNWCNQAGAANWGNPGCSGQAGADAGGNPGAGNPSPSTSRGNPVYSGQSGAASGGNPRADWSANPASWGDPGTNGSANPASRGNPGYNGWTSAPGGGDPAGAANWADPGSDTSSPATGWGNPPAGSPSPASGEGDPNGYRQVGAANRGNPGYNGWASAHGGGDPSGYHQASTASWGEPGAGSPSPATVLAEPASDTPPPGADPGYGYIFSHTRGRKCLVFTNSREECEAVTTSLRQYCEAKGEGDRFLIHHGNLSASYRESAEDLMKDDSRSLTTVTTATLELGIDIGRLERAFQLDAPFTVSAFLQRMGRTGRRGRPREMRFVVREDPPEPRAMFPSTVPWKLLQAIALIELYREERWVEPPRLSRLPYSLLYHQTLCTLASGGEMTPAELASRVLTLTCFSRISRDDFRTLLLHLIETDQIQRTPEGGLIVGLAGERQINSYRFLAVFQENEEFTVRDESQEIGTIVYPPPPGEKIAIAGHVWVVEEVDRKRHLVYCAKVKGKVPAYFGECPGDINTRVLERMRRVLAEDMSYPYLMPNAAARLAQARRTAALSGVRSRVLLPLGGDMWCLFPWLGTYAFLALERLLKIKCAKRLKLRGLDVSRPYFMQFRMAAGEEEFFAVAREEAARDFSPMDLVYPGEVPLFEKYDEFVPEELVRKGFAYGVLDIDGMKRRVGSWEGQRANEEVSR